MMSSPTNKALVQVSTLSCRTEWRKICKAKPFSNKNVDTKQAGCNGGGEGGAFKKNI
jgi:hypothetical protein